jgi:ABC-type transport system substrate-binding protein
MEMEKKNLAIIILAVVLAASGVGNVILAMMAGVIEQPDAGEVLKLARTANPVTMDPCDTWDSVSNDIIDQVVEPLVATDLTDPNFALIPRLAVAWDFQSDPVYGANITFTLRENVFFHDGQLFTGEDVIHTFERINYFGNWTGDLAAPNHMAFPHSLYKFASGKPIFNDTLSRAWWDANKATDLYTVILFMNGEFAPAEGLLAYTASGIVGHESTPATTMLDLSSDLAVGTGPFKLTRYVPNSEVRFARWERYWRTGAYWDALVYVYYRDAVTANNAMLAGDIDYLGQGIASLKPDFEADPDITVTGDGTLDFINGSIYWYIAFNSQILNQTWRKAMCHAFNFTYLNQEIDEGTTVKANSLVPPGFPAHNSSVIGGTFNIPFARTLMQQMGFGAGLDLGTQTWGSDEFTAGTDEAAWAALNVLPETGNFTNNALNFRHRQGSHFMELVIQRFTEDMDMIGINIQQQVLTWDEFIELGENHPDRLHVYFVGWGPDYFETFNMIDPLVNEASSSNFAQIQDPTLQAFLEATAAETDTLTRYDMYEWLQWYIHDVQYYHMPLEYDKLYHVHAANMKGFPYNSMRNLYWYPTYRV